MKLLLPMHHATIVAEKCDGQEAIVMKVGTFHRAKLVPGEIHTTERNQLEIRIDERVVRFRILKITFLEGR